MVTGLERIPYSSERTGVHCNATTASCHQHHGDRRCAALRWGSRTITAECLVQRKGADHTTTKGPRQRAGAAKPRVPNVAWTKIARAAVRHSVILQQLWTTRHATCLHAIMRRSRRGRKSTPPSIPHGRRDAKRTRIPSSVGEPPTCESLNVKQQSYPNLR